MKLWRQKFQNIYAFSLNDYYDFFIYQLITFSKVNQIIFESITTLL